MINLDLDNKNYTPMTSYVESPETNPFVPYHTSQ